MTTVVTPADEVRAKAIAASCSRRLSGHGRTTLPEQVELLRQEAARDGDIDTYGAGGVVTELEEAIRDLFGAEAAVLLPTGTMAQQIALRLHAEARGPSRVSLHPTSHLVLWEEDAASTLSGLEPVIEGDPSELAGLAAVVIELPRRETGGHLLPWDDLVDLSFRCTDAGVALHIDGARLWQCGPAYDPRTLSEVAALADTTYLSLYKDLGGLAGAVLLCPWDCQEAVRTWRHRYGGTLPALWPLALSARRGLREHLPRMPLYVGAASALAGTGLEVVTPPVTAMLHVVLEGDPQRLADALVDVAESSGVWLSGGVRPGPREGTGAVELSCGEATLLVEPAEAAELLARASHLAR